MAQNNAESAALLELREFLKELMMQQSGAQDFPGQPQGGMPSTEIPVDENQLKGAVSLGQGDAAAERIGRGVQGSLAGVAKSANKGMPSSAEVMGQMGGEDEEEEEDSLKSKMKRYGKPRAGNSGAGY